MNERDSFDKLSARLTDCEMLVAHLERAVQELDGVVIGQQKRIDALEKRLESLTGALTSLSAPEPQERKPEDEKPPHY